MTNDLTVSTAVDTLLASADKAAIAGNAVGGVAINPSSIGATTPGTGAFTNITVSEMPGSRIPVTITNRDDGRFGVTSAGSGIFEAGGTYFNIAKAANFGWSDYSGAPDLTLWRDTAHSLALRNSTNTQSFAVYQTYTDASNYSRMRLADGNASTEFRVSSEAAGTGTARDLALVVPNANAVAVYTGTTKRWHFNATGLMATADNTYDIGASGANRPKNYFGAGNITIGGFLAVGTSGAFSLFQSNGNGIAGLYNGAATDFNRLQFGGTTSSFPAIKKNGATLEDRLADDSGFCARQSLYQRFGAGTPEGAVAAPVGATYSRTDGGAGTSCYVKESGTGNTGWVAK